MKPQTNEHPKRPYTKPEVVEYGTIEALTSASATGTKTDGSVFTLAS